MTVAILLCFVLISTSVVSGIFAKYVITKSAGATVSLKAFGLTLEVSGTKKTNVVTAVTTSNAKVNSTSVDVASTVSLAPGEDTDDAITVTISNKAKVNTNLKIEVIATYSNFAVTNVGGVGSTSTTFIPIKFTTRINDATTDTTIFRDWQQPSDNNNFGELIATGLKDAISDSSRSGRVVTKQICTLSGTATEAPPIITSIKFGFECPDVPTQAIDSKYNTDLIQTKIASQSPTLTVIYRISLEQIINNG